MPRALTWRGAGANLRATVNDIRQPADAYLRSLLLCLLAGGVLTALGLPLGWLIGSLVATGYLALRGAAAVPACP